MGVCCEAEGSDSNLAPTVTPHGQKGSRDDTIATVKCLLVLVTYIIALLHGSGAMTTPVKSEQLSEQEV